MITRVAKILLPKENFDYSKWAVIACDQFTSQKNYWENLSQYVASDISALHLIFPEVYLQDDDKDERTEKINGAMASYLSADIFREVNNLILVDRTLNNGQHRLGLMLAVDLEKYDYTPYNDAPIKATEKTIIDRLPPRIEIRKNASLELPHIMLLMDDIKNSILPNLYNQRQNMDVLYDFDLNMNGGHIVGYKIENGNEVLQQIDQLTQQGSPKGISFVVGDGNHSLATAKECWNIIKEQISPQERETHSARFALCELVNLWDSSLVFQPIHRVVKNADMSFVQYMQKAVSGPCATTIIYQENQYNMNIPMSPSDAIADIQNAIDQYAQHNHIIIDYIHGDNYLREVAQSQQGVGIFMPTLSKDTLFEYCARRGVLPRKSFSMGFAEDKRYYLEAKRIK